MPWVYQRATGIFDAARSALRHAQQVFRHQEGITPLKCRESGMPEEALWASFFNADAAVAQLWPEPRGDALELGCGFGTFTLAAARCTQGIITALDIDPEMIVAVRTKANALKLANIHVREHDFVASDLGVASASQSHAMIYNLLHMEAPVRLLHKVRHALEIHATVSVMHWRTDVPTPRGPPMNIRPTPDDCAAWLIEAGFHRIQFVDLSKSCPFHYGLIAHVAA
jgi:SAM-dependent methyltransferase